MQPVLIHRGELVAERLVEVVDNCGVTFHESLPVADRRRWKVCRLIRSPGRPSPAFRLIERKSSACDSRDSNSWSPQTKDVSVHSGTTGIAGRFARVATPPLTKIMNSGRHI
jgi:hypothetical protein